MSKRSNVNIASVVLVVVLLTGVLYGCASGNGGDNAPAASGDSAAAPAPAAEGVSFPLKERIKVSGFVLNMLGKDGQPNGVYEEMMKRTNIEFTNMYTEGDDLNAKFSALVAANDVPDLSEVTSNADKIKEWGDQGLFLDLKPYLDNGSMPNYKKYLDKYDGWRAVTSPEGKIYQATIFIEFNGRPFVGLMIRKDIFSKYGQKTEGYETWDELFEAMEVIRDQTGKYVWDAYNAQIIGMLAPLFGANASVYFDGEKYAFGPYSPGFKLATQWYNRMLDAKLIGPDWNSRDVTTMLEAIGSGERFMLINHFNVADSYQPVQRQTNPEADFGAIAPPKIDGKYPAGAPQGSIVETNAGYAISAKTRYKEELVAFLDYWYSDEGIELSHYGREGIDFTKDADGGYTRSADLKTPVNPSGTRNMVDEGILIRWMQVRPLQPLMDSIFGEKVAEGEALYSDLNIIGPAQPYLELSADELSEANNLKAVLNTYVAEKFASYVNGQISFDKWEEDFIKGARDMGADALVTIYQTAYDRQQP